SLGILLKQPGQPQTRALIERIREQVKAGKPLSVALEEEGSQFSPLYISMVRAGEAGGALVQVPNRRTRLAGPAAGLRRAAVRAYFQGSWGADPVDH
ncbi:proteinral secretion pathway protein F, partial [Pseudomonas syringae pv. maculicola]